MSDEYPPEPNLETAFDETNPEPDPEAAPTASESAAGTPLVRVQHQGVARYGFVIGSRDVDAVADAPAYTEVTLITLDSSAPLLVDAADVEPVKA